MSDGGRSQDAQLKLHLSPDSEILFKTTVNKSATRTENKFITTKMLIISTFIYHVYVINITLKDAGWFTFFSQMLFYGNH